MTAPGFTSITVDHAAAAATQMPGPQVACYQLDAFLYGSSHTLIQINF